MCRALQLKRNGLVVYIENQTLHELKQSIKRHKVRQHRACA